MVVAVEAEMLSVGRWEVDCSARSVGWLGITVTASPLVVIRHHHHKDRATDSPGMETSNINSSSSMASREDTDMVDITRPLHLLPHRMEHRSSSRMVVVAVEEEDLILSRRSTEGILSTVLVMATGIMDTDMVMARAVGRCAVGNFMMSRIYERKGR